MTVLNTFVILRFIYIKDFAGFAFCTFYFKNCVSFIYIFSFSGDYVALGFYSIFSWHAVCLPQRGLGLFCQQYCLLVEQLPVLGLSVEQLSSSVEGVWRTRGLACCTCIGFAVMLTVNLNELR